MKKLQIAGLIAAVLLAGLAPAAEKCCAGKADAKKSAAVKMSDSVPKGWMEDFEAAKRKAKSEKKRILMVFSGSDWCGWCVKFEKDVLSKPEFTDEAAKKFVLVMIDTPQDQNKLSDLAKKQNPKLLQRFGVRGFPSWKVLDAKGRSLYDGSGYVNGGPEGFLSKLETIK